MQKSLHRRITREQMKWHQWNDIDCGCTHRSNIACAYGPDGPPDDWRPEDSESCDCECHERAFEEDEYALYAESEDPDEG